MFQRSAARPLALTAALLLFPACDSGDGDGGDTDVSTSGTTDPGTATTNQTGSTGAQGSSSGSGASSSDGNEGSSSSEGSSSGGESTSSGGESSSGEAAVGYADLYGDYVDNFDNSHTLSAEGWTQAYMGMNPFTLVIEEVDDDLQWVAGMEGEDGTYGRHDWVIDDNGQLRLCTAAFGEATLQDAIDAPPSDAGDLDGVGCGGAFGWSILTEAP